MFKRNVLAKSNKYNGRMREMEMRTDGKGAGQGQRKEKQYEDGETDRRTENG